MKITIKKYNPPYYYVIGMLEEYGKTINVSNGLRKELVRFQEAAQEVQALLHALYVGNFTPEGQLKRIVENMNDTYNRRHD